jgi:hypothetical protein
MAERPKQLSCYPDNELEQKIQDSVEEYDISVSQWLIEAARNKLQAEGKL